MKLNENYNRAEQKYGKELAQLILSIGIPNEYVFIACQYHKEDNYIITYFFLTYNI